MASHPTWRQIAGVLLVTASVVTACSAPTNTSNGGSEVADVDRAPSAFHGTLLDSSAGRPDLTLQDTAGRPFSLADRPDDEVTVIFFGYTHCPDVCPTTMADLAVAGRQLPPGVREQVTVAFITEDPQRDTPEALRAWLDQFDSSFLGLLGGNEATQSALAELLLPETTRVPDEDGVIEHPAGGGGSHDHGDDTGDDTVEHSATVYAFGPGGATVIYTGGTTPDQYAEDFALLAQGS